MGTSEAAKHQPTSSTASDAILPALEALGGEASIADVEQWIADNLTQSWKDIGTHMADLADPASPSTQYPAERRFLLKLGNGRYRIRDDWRSGGAAVAPTPPAAARSRKAFIEAHGATCRNWTWSWSFVNESQRIVIFGAWDMHTTGNRSLILDEEWAITPAGRRSPAYQQSRDHVRLVEEHGFELYTFPMKHSAELHDANGIGPARIAGFTPVLSRRTLVSTGSQWYASDDEGPSTLPEQVPSTDSYREGAATQVLVNGYERNEQARRACIEHFGAVCQVCRFDFSQFYGPMGRGVIHVHHLAQLAHRDGEYEVDPIRDLIPVCPNCHAMIHLTREPLAIEVLQALVTKHGRRQES
jgi:5-methylcytosine-specific restriction protein A